ncbi:dTDP-4-dehydrorhamnose 3,5-epimerase [Paenibacillus thermoaerophilus]|nr:dTDP-4-dehydrorhamnose 3,5-epimerase [Paenibacillus thermoaerophilus]
MPIRIYRREGGNKQAGVCGLVNVCPTGLPGVYVLEPRAAEDTRGFFMESFREQWFSDRGWPSRFVQDNHSLSVRPGTLRGLHYQLPPMAQAKLVRVISGAVYDVAVDMRRSSPFFGRWVGVELSAENKLQLWIPEGFAHGFCTLVPNTEVIYKVNAYYSPECDRGVAWNDPDLGIAWPVEAPVLSAKDAALPRLREAETFA